MKEFKGRVAVITGAASGFGREFARTAAHLGMRLVLADVEPGALETVAQELRGQGTDVVAECVDVSVDADMARLAHRSREAFGGTQLLFNNAGVACGGYAWEHSEADWRWVLGVNLWGVVHGIRHFVPMMLEQRDTCHIVNTASAAGLVSTPSMAAYNVSKHGVVTLSETLYQDLHAVGADIGITVLCPAFVDTGIAHSARNRPQALRNTTHATPSMRAMQQATEHATAAGRLSAADIARLTFDAIRAQVFYLIPHTNLLPAVEARLQDILAIRSPGPFPSPQGHAPAHQP
ncbi:MAG: SDR family NAD(P)-dependent oxidoreductase [Nevskiaceae bacterium]|nr:MAG: SDR family NAD(P)-dependent oxidoreductase [Nevskiaceae bacterium]TBR73315.1 MAG: SDR family NAD(P)-dependent oxidoreductase [Nevskiaceae bacterium]